MSRTLYIAFTILVSIFFTLLALRIHPIAGIAVGIMCVGYLLYAVIPLSQGLTLSGQRQLNKYRKTTTRDDRYTISTDNIGTTVSRDGDVVSMFVEILPSPLESVAYTDDGSGIPNVPLSLIADTMRQFDITVDSMNILSFGYTSSEDTPYARAYQSALRNNPTHWRTIIEVSVRLSTSMPEVNMRRDNEDGPEIGLVRLATVASKRLRNRLTDEGWHARVMSKNDLVKFDNEVSAHLGDAFNHEHRFNMGSGNKWVAAYATSDLKASPNKISEEATAIGIIRKVVPSSSKGASVTTLVCLFGEDENDVKARKDLKYKRLPNVQGDVICHLLPLAQNPLISTSLPKVTKKSTKELHIPSGIGPAWGIGTLLGEIRTDNLIRRVSLTTASAKNGNILYLNTNTNFVRNIVSRMITTGEKVFVEASGEEWDTWIQRMNNPRLTRKRGEANIILTTSNGGEVRPRANTLLLVVTPRVPRNAKFYITQQPNQTMRIVHGRTYRDFTWSSQPAENQWWLNRGN